MTPVRLVLFARGAALILLLLLLILLEPSIYCRNVDLFQQDSSLVDGRHLKRVVNYNWVKRSEEADPSTSPETLSTSSEKESRDEGNSPTADEAANAEETEESVDNPEEQGAIVNSAPEVANAAPPDQNDEGPAQEELQSGPITPTDNSELPTTTDEAIEAEQQQSQQQDPSVQELEAVRKEPKTDISDSLPASDIQTEVKPAIKDEQPKPEVTPTSVSAPVPPSTPNPSENVPAQAQSIANSSPKLPEVVVTPETVTPEEQVSKYIAPPVTLSVPVSTNQSNLLRMHVDSNSIMADNKSEPYDIRIGEERWSYKIDNSCDPLETRVPDTILRLTLDRIFDSLAEPSCSKSLKLQPLANKQLANHLMEVSSMPIGVNQLFSGRDTLVKCIPATDREPNEEKLRKFDLVLLQEFDDLRLESKWRHHPRLKLDDIPLSSSFSLISLPSLDRNSSGIELSGRNQQKLGVQGMDRVSKRCQRFKLEGGEFYLKLLELRTEARFSVQLKYHKTTIYAASVNHGGQIKLKEFKVRSLFLDHTLMMSTGSYQQQIGLSSGFASDESKPTAQATVQVLHEHNNHFRRNNWLLSLYGNWLRQEYRKQLSQLLTSRALLSHMNTCLANRSLVDA